MDSSAEQRLKYLEFIHSASVQAIIHFSNLYCYAKDKSGPLKPDVESVEGTIKTVVGPVYDRFHDVPFQLIKFVDHKVDESLTKLDNQVPPVIKKLPNIAHTIASEVQNRSMMETTSGIARTAYSKYEPVAEQYAVSTWRSLNRLPLFAQVAQVLVPTAAFCTEKYNQSVMAGSERGYRVASYLPLVPTDRIAKVFECRDARGSAVCGSGGNDPVVAVQ